MRKLLTLAFVVLLASCDKEKELYYERPDWLQGPLYEQIKSTGEYDEFISLVEYIGYDDFLSSRLTFTLFLPTNEAFQEYYNERGVSGFRGIDTTELQELVEYHLMENSWDSIKLGNKTSWSYWGTIPDNFRTPSYYAPPISTEEGRNIYREKTFLHLFSIPFFQYFGLSSIDYESFFPGSGYTGYNIGRASIVNDQNGAENGFYYVIDRVMLPRTTADRMISKNTDFSVFMDLANIFLNFKYNSTASERNQNYDSLYSRSYSLNVDLANEKITDSAPDGYYHVIASVFIPTNDVVINYFNTNFPAYSGIDNVPNIIIKYFVEAHLINNKKLFPSVLAKDQNETNDFSDEIDYDLDNGIILQEFSSNAIIYGVDRAINSNAFATVSGPIIKNPDYTIFTMMLELSEEIKTFFKREIGHVAFVLNDERMTDLGYSYYEGDPVDFTDDRIFYGNDEMSTTEIKEFLQDYISITYKDLESSNETFVKTKSDNYLSINNEQVKGLFGNAHILNSLPATNGHVLEVDETMAVSEPYTIKDYLNDNKENYTEFYDLLSQGGFVDAEGNITKLSVFNGVTLLLPTDEAVNAIKGSYIPESGDFNYRNLVQYQIISERTIFTDDEFPASDYGTDLFLDGVRIKINAEASDNQVKLVDRNGNTIIITPGPGSNIITSSGIIHIVDKVALY